MRRQRDGALTTLVKAGGVPTATARCRRYNMLQRTGLEHSDVPDYREPDAPCGTIFRVRMADIADSQARREENAFGKWALGPGEKGRGGAQAGPKKQ